MRDLLRTNFPRTLIIVAVCSITTSALLGKTINVPSDYPTIQSAANVALPGDTVLVQPGTYFESIVWPEVSGVSLISAQGPSVTIIDGNYKGAVLIAYYGANLFEGFTIQRGNGGDGGGISVGGENILENLIVINNSVSDDGGGIYCVENPTIENVEVSNNQAGFNGGGGGVCIASNSKATLEHCQISNNDAKFGGGILCQDQSAPVLTDLVIVHNSASSWGGGIYCGAGTQQFEHITVAENQAGYSGGGVEYNGSNGTMRDSYVFENTAGVNGGGFEFDGGSPVISNTSICNNSSDDLGGAGYGWSTPNPTLVNVTVTGNKATILGNGFYWIVNQLNPSGSFTHSNFEANGVAIDAISTGNIINADSCWWGDKTGPYHRLQNSGGEGDTTSDYVKVTPFLAEPDTSAPPPPPRGVSISAVNSNSVTLVWSKSLLPNLSGYKVYFKDSTQLFFPGADTLTVGTDTTCTISGLLPGKTYRFSVSCINKQNSEGCYSSGVTSTTSVTKVVTDEALLVTWSLGQNYPDPFNPSTTIQYSLPSRSNVRISIANVLGQQITTLVNGDRNGGIHEVVWHANVASGIYFYRIEAVSVTDPTSKFVQVKKMLLLK